MTNSGHPTGVLVVDDDTVVRVMVQLALEQSGFEVWVAANGHDAIRLYGMHQDRIALVLLDVRMPGLDGPCTLDGLREVNPDVAACFMSGDRGQHTPEDLMRRGAVRIFHKPFRLDELAAALRSLADGSKGGPSCWYAHEERVNTL